jgi:hypothetical protein
MHPIDFLPCGEFFILITTRKSDKYVIIFALSTGYSTVSTDFSTGFVEKSCRKKAFLHFTG